MVRFHFPGQSTLEWKGNTTSPRGRFISYLKARKMIAKSYIYHLVRVHGVEAKPPTLQSVPVGNEFLDAFPDEIPSIPLEREIDFVIDVLPDTQPISISPYRMAPAELKELKEQLKDLLEEGIRSRCQMFFKARLKIRLSSGQVDGWVFLEVSPMKGVMRFSKKGNLSPRYIRSYRIICKVGRVAYELDLPSDLESVHSIFHVSMLRKCIKDPSRVVPVDNVQITKQLSYEEVPTAILDRQVRRLRTKDVASVKVLWRNKNVEEMTWDAEEDMMSR
ncbi:uncharacterized protein LOC132054212 [Lycium ferocissimum]|uniref:uncharacterized protein LOC132054212 n=1 Tax=Lycium ferocissimum TaxID=112874 RepID=UPI0028169BCD|nr:uncharacterized protein LOC132054212 [Lycium ferocissimum]